MKRVPCRFSLESLIMPEIQVECDQINCVETVYVVLSSPTRSPKGLSTPTLTSSLIKEGPYPQARPNPPSSPTTNPFTLWPFATQMSLLPKAHFPPLSPLSPPNRPSYQLNFPCHHLQNIPHLQQLFEHSNPSFHQNGHSSLPDCNRNRYFLHIYTRT